MKTKQPYMQAIMPATARSYAVNHGGHKETLSTVKLIDKRTERVVVDARWYQARSPNTHTMYCSIWCNGASVECSGHGQASGWDYHKQSAACQDAIHSAGVELYGSPYDHPVNGDTLAQTRAMIKTRAYIGGCGERSILVALCAIAYAMGYKNCVMVQS